MVKIVIKIVDEIKERVWDYYQTKSAKLVTQTKIQNGIN